MIISKIKSKLHFIRNRIIIWLSKLDNEQRKVNTDIAKALCIASIVGGVFGTNHSTIKSLMWLVLAIIFYIIAIKQAKKKGGE